MRSNSETKAFTLVETMMVIAVLAVLAVAMFGYYKNVVENVQLKRAQNDLNVLKKGIVEYRHIYGNWPSQVEQVLNAGLVKFPEKPDYARDLRNNFGYSFSIEKNIRGFSVSTKTKTRSGFESQLRVKFTPPYKAQKDMETIFLANFDRGTNSYKADYPESAEPDVNSANVTIGKGMLGFGNGLDFGNPGGGVEYPVSIPAFRNITIEFWLSLHDIPASYGGDQLIVSMKGIDAKNNTYPAGTSDPREVSVYISGNDLVLELMAYNASETANPTATTSKLFTLNIFSLLGFPTLPNNIEDKWNHFAIVYSNSNTESQVMFYINGAEYNPVDTTPTVTFYPMLYDGTYPKFDNRLYIGGGAGYDNLFDAYLDNINITGRAKSAEDLMP
ncbi:MAG: hypothetical protein C0601_06790 [Candidatus Muiribacterium halophilum]|uniref:Uncharacterized protein n=1 Tax=Muiribacterium halophilum TaxID=2053465 RepID=A0A2N5ZGI4_MUIH1|nr:MAG: hypothetical protein C0601_06790 [Candidatus Muirbacterium halophilum]